MGLLLLYVGGALAISFLCSVLEATLLSARTGELTERRSRGDRGAALLLELKQERVDDAIAAILTLNTIAHTVGATLAGAQAAFVFGDLWVGLFSGVLTLLVLIFTEIIPKTLGTIYASQLAGVVARTTDFLTRVLKLPLLALRLLTRWFATAGHRPRISRREVVALVASAASQGSLDEETSACGLQRSPSSSGDRGGGDDPTHSGRLVMLPEGTTISELTADDEAKVFSRIPLYRDTRDDVTGHVLQRDATGGSGGRRDGDPTIGVPTTIPDHPRDGICGAGSATADRSARAHGVGSR